MGPVGSILALHLQAGGAEVIVCDTDKEKMNLVRQKGITLENCFRKAGFFRYVHTSVSEIGVYDPEIIVCAVKGHHLGAVLEGLAQIRTEQTYIVSAQNGIDIEREYLGVFGEDKVLRMVINFAGNLHAPNVVNVSFFQSPNYIASVNDRCREVAEDFSECLSRSGLTTQISDSFGLPRYVWEKTILNAALSALCAVTRFTMKEAMEYPGTMEIVEQTIEEAVAVAHCEDIFFDNHFVKHCLRYLRQGGQHLPSLAVDVMNGRETEIRYFNGKIVAYGRKHYIRTPLNLAFTNMIEAMTRKGTFPGSEAQEIKDIIHQPTPA